MSLPKLQLIVFTTLCFLTTAFQAVAPQQSALEEAASLSRQVIQLYARGLLDEAMPLAERALELRAKSLPANDPLIAEALSNLGSLYQLKRDHEKAEDYFKRALSIFEKASGPQPGVYAVLDSLSLLRFARGDLRKSEAYARESLTSKEKTLGPEHLEVAKSLAILIKIHEEQNDHSKAKPLYLRVVSILEKSDKPVPEMLARVLASHGCSVSDENQSVQRRIDSLFVRLYPDNEAAGKRTVSGGVLNGKALCLAKPEYPLMARENRVKGTVVVQVTIDEAGKVVSAKAVSGAPELSAVSEAAASRSRFTPTYLSGYPVKVTGIVTYNFVAR